MAYKKKNRGASLVVNQFDNQLNIVGNYFKDSETYAIIRLKGKPKEK